MSNIIAVRVRNTGPRLYFNPGALELREGDEVIIPTSQGMEHATVCQTPVIVQSADPQKPLPQVLRLASEADQRQVSGNRQKEAQALQICRERIAAHKLDMKLVSVEYTFDNSKLIANFTSSGRVDFRALVKDLAGIFKTRIELRQIGVRDEARLIGGMGSCGRGLCCSGFLTEFQPVSIRMAKDQSLSLNPTKISGMCGRLMCCLKYEQDQYEKSRKRLPKLGKEVITPLGRGIVTQVNALLETVSVRVNTGEGSDIHQFTAEQVQRVNPPQQARQSAKARPVNEVPEDVSEGDEEFLGTPETITEDDLMLPDED